MNAVLLEQIDKQIFFHARSQNAIVITKNDDFISLPTKMEVIRK